jgi:hypothetical protein
MGFKTMNEYNEDKYANLFTLRDDGDSADVIILYRNTNEVLIGDTHYIKSPEYSGYVHCNGVGCPACGKGIRVQTRLFIPIYLINENKIVFFDRNVRFESQLQNDVFSKFDDPTQYVFTITRHGVAGDINTTYSITVRAKNNFKSYEEICSEFGITFPDHYSEICREYSNSELSKLLSKDNNNSVPVGDMPDYTIKPRVTTTPGDAPQVQDTAAAIDALEDYSADDSEELSDDDAPDFG